MSGAACDDKQVERSSPNGTYESGVDGRRRRRREGDRCVHPTAAPDNTPLPLRAQAGAEDALHGGSGNRNAGDSTGFKCHWDLARER
uniref:Uncharacterized protein n=1 Tax=Knipowitschia caucasica TaxID=637954 RepID=A0AAV2LNL6_KNICA